jgi:hypothetical protein
MPNHAAAHSADAPAKRPQEPPPGPTPGTGRGGTPADAWARYAPELADFAWRRLVNRSDVWGSYNPVEDRDRIVTRPDGSQTKLGASCTRPAKSKRGKVLLTRATLEHHFRARGPQEVVGLHSTSPENTSLWGALDIDHHGPAGTFPEVNWRAALHWYRVLARHGFRPLLTDSNGAGGYHLRILLDAPAPTARVFHFLKRLAADHARLGMAAPPETFPKQASVSAGRFGNWLRLFGRHHTREHWSRVWGGSRWLDGAAAVEFILALRPDPVALLPEAPEPAPGPRQATRRYAAAPGDNLSARIAAYMARLPNLAEGQGRDDVAYHFACFLVRDLQLADDIALGWLERWDAGNSPPKGEARLREIIASAHAYGHHAYGSGLGVAPVPRGGGHMTLSGTLEIF